MKPEHKQLFSFKNVSWYFWDFGTQILFINASIYFSQWLVVDNNVPDIWFSAAFIASTIALVFLSPYLGFHLDKRANRKQVFYALTVLTLLSAVLLQAAGHSNSFFIKIVITIVLYSLFNLFYQLAAFIFNTFLQDLSTEKTAGTVAGLGGGLSTIGDVVGLLVTVPIVSGGVYLLGHSRIDVMVPAALLAVLFCIPMFISFRAHKDTPAEIAERKSIYKSIWQDLRNTNDYPGVTRLLVAFYFYSDAILTLQLFSAIYLEKVFHMTDAQKVPVFITVYLAFTLGAWGGGRLGDKLGNKKVLIAGLFFTAVTIMLIAVSPAGNLALVWFGLFGLGTGITFVTTKALFSLLIPYHKKAQFFGLYSISEKFASIVGPAVWALIVFAVPANGAVNYRVAAFAMSGFLVAGAFVVKKIKTPPHTRGGVLKAQIILDLVADSKRSRPGPGRP
jgi:UMF1 family MFS transporter